MPNYIHKGIPFETELKFFRTKLSSNESITEVNGVVVIESTSNRLGIPQPTTQLKEFKININGAIYRRVSTESIIIKLYKFIGHPQLDRVVTEDSIIIVGNENTTLAQFKDALDCNLLEYISGDISKFTEVNVILNKNITIDRETEPQNLKNTRDLYLMNMTKALEGVILFLKSYLKTSQGIELYVFPAKIPTKQLDYAMFSYEEFPTDLTRFWPHSELNHSEYHLKINLKISTGSVSKYERYVNDFNSLKFLSGINRITVKDFKGADWKMPFMWEIDTEKSDPSKVETSTGEVGFELGVSSKTRYVTVRREDLVVIDEILTRINLVKQTLL